MERVLKRSVALWSRTRHAAGEGPAGRQDAPDLVRRDFSAAAINRKWYGDGTEIPTGEGKLHLDIIRNNLAGNSRLPRRLNS
jgi:hypothetical protein